MGGMDILKEAGQNLTDGIEKAVIEIVDERKEGEEIIVMNERAKKAADKAELSKKVLKEVIDNIDKTLEVFKGDTPLKNPPRQKIYEVKFNPSQISFQAHGGRKASKPDLAKTNADNQGVLKMEYQEWTPIIQMNVQLIFDDYERTQAFMMEKITDPAALVRNGVVAGVSAYQNKTYSIRPQVEGFIGALRNNFTRKIRFCWGNMIYTGVLNHVGAEYTMFSTDGNPIRANVNLGMLCTDATLSKGYMGQWQESYQKVFKSDKTTNLGSVTQHVGNLFNVNL